MPLIPSFAREDRSLGGEQEKLGMQSQAGINQPSRLASKAAGQPMGMSYIPPLDLPTSMNASMSGGSPTAPAAMGAANPKSGEIANKQGIKRRIDTNKAAMTGQ